MSTKNKIIVSGLALGKDTDPNTCQSCSFDASWIFQHPSTLLWADSILVTPTILSMINTGAFPTPKKQPASKREDIIKIIFNKAGEHGLLEVKNPSKYIDEGVLDTIRAQVENDRKTIAKTFPSTVTLDVEEGVPGSIRIENQDYCMAYLLSIYYSLVLANLWKAEILFDHHAFTFTKYMFGTRMDTAMLRAKNVQTFEELFREQLPELDIRPYTGDRDCLTCAHHTECDKSEISDIEHRITEYLRLRDYDEVIQMKALHSKLAVKVKSEELQDFNQELKREFNKVQSKLQKRMHKTFPVATRWSNLITILSIPIVVAGLSTGSNALAGVGAGIAGTSEVAKQSMNILASKNRWLCFRQGHSESVTKKTSEISDS